MDHIGIDVRKRESQIYVLAEGGEVVEQRIRTESERFAAVLGARPRARIVIEASTDSEWVARCLEALGHEVIVADPNFAPMYATRSRKVKTDRRDARALAEACLLGAYRLAHRLSDPQRHVRGRLLVRDAVVRTRTRYISLIRALLRQHGYRVPSGSAENFVARVQGLPLPGRLRSVVAPPLALMRPLNKTDPDLQAAHAAYPWALTWHDHEVDNDYAADQSQDRDDPQAFARRRGAAYQAYWEHMPLRRASMPRGTEMRLYHRLTFGDLVEMSVLDGRQYRSVQPCGEGPRGGGRVVEPERCAARLDPRQTMLGPFQERWLLGGLGRSRARWNVIAQQQLMAELLQRTRSGAPGYWTDGWDGYAAARARILSHIATHKPANPVVIGGDIHSFWVTDLKPDFRDASSPTMATEFVSTSVTSAGVPYDAFAAMLPDNPHVRFFESRHRGYVRCEVTPERWQADLRVVSDVRDRAATARTLATFVVESGRPGAQRA